MLYETSVLFVAWDGVIFVVWGRATSVAVRYATKPHIIGSVPRTFHRRCSGGC